MPKLHSLQALEILDSRGRPTVQATCHLAGGTSATAQVPSGASTGKAEAVELRDGDPNRHGGLGCRRAVAHIEGPMADRLVGLEWNTQRDLDLALIEADGTPDKSRWGANAILAVSIAFARAHARQRSVPLCRHFADMAGIEQVRMPRPTVNLFSGGKHAGGQVAIQDLLVIPRKTNCFDEALAQVCAVYQAAVRRCRQRYGMRPLVADEGGLAPPFPNAKAMFVDAVESIREAGFKPGDEMGLAVDLASSHFYSEGRYSLDGQSLTGKQMIEVVCGWLDEFPIVSVEDALSEEDWEHWPEWCRRVAGRACVLGDDFLCSHPERIRRAIENQAANALLLKVNQIGTLTEALESAQLAWKAGWHVTVSARSGETEDHWLADLAVGWRGDHIKIGSITRSERLAKYNRLLEIERDGLTCGMAPR